MAKEQNYKNHIRWYPPHHFIFYPVMLAVFVSAVYFAANAGDDKLLWIFISGIIVSVIWLSYMLRQHYALTLQNRVVLMELRYRYYVITGNRLEPFEERLTEGQLFALRFAPDEELPPLLQRAINENLSADDIKKAIVNWKPDHRRV